MPKPNFTQTRKQRKNIQVYNFCARLKVMKKRLIISFVFLTPLMYVAMHQMLNHLLGLPIPEVIKNIFLK